MIRRSRRSDLPDTGRPGPSGWSNPVGPTPARRIRRHVPTLVLLIPLVVGLLGSPAMTSSVRGDELSDAKAKAAAIKKEVAKQKAQIAAINDLQAGLSAEIADTKNQLRKIGADLDAVRKKISQMAAKINEVKAVYEDLVKQLVAMDAELQRVMAQEAAKRVELAERRAQLADRVRSAYDTDRTSPLETFLSGGSFTDLLAEMSYYIDVGEQDRALADQIVKAKETLAAIHQTVADTRARTNVLRQETAAQKRDLDKAMRALQETKQELRRLEKQVARTLAQQKARFAALARSKKNAAAIIRQAAMDQKKLQREINSMIARQVARGNIPSEFNGTMRWPMDDFSVSGEYGCSSFEYYAPGNGCAHFHNGIDLVAKYGTPVKAAAAGEVVYVGWNWADGADPAWIVVVAHSGNLKTWYAHMQPKRPVAVGQSVKKGQIVGYEGSTGHATGPHLHWMTELNGNFVNPRLFL
ncbi:MAG TPA: peptidoglycan DD-metalloendopeptidase family protein [Candidatus Limnocylindrales bacterium]|nr:peptidoglycan DD-metalloendopeptidase family protein [Candidatus Limnocylindrales bacterium]